MDFSELRDSIALTSTMTYLNTGWAGPSPEPVLERMRAALEEEAALGPASPQGLAVGRTLAVEAVAGAAKMLGAGEDEVALTHGTTEGVNMVLHGLPWQAGDELVTADLEHPALASTTKVVAERYGVVVREVEIPPQASADEMVSRITAALTPRTRLVALSHIQFTCGLRMPLEPIATATHAAGALLLVDGAQTGGQITLDMPSLGADFYAISGQKWLFGATGTGALFIRRESREGLRPMFTAHDLDAGGRRAGARLYELTTNGAGLVAGFAEGLRIHLELGPERIEARVRELSGRLRAALEGAPGVELTSPSDPDTSSGLVSVAIEGMAPEDLTSALWDNHRIVARTVANPPGVRMSTAPFNTHEEMDLTAAAVHEIARAAAKG